MLCCLALIPSRLAAAEPEALYVDYYQLIQQGSQLLEAGKGEAAFALFRRAEEGLKQLKQDFPQWNDKIVNFRLADLADKIKPLAAKFPEPIPAPPAPVMTVPKANAKAAPAVPSPASTSFESQLSLLNEEIIRLRLDRALMERKLAEALAARPAAADPAELAKVEARNASLQKENDVLKAANAEAQKAAANMVDAAVVAETRKQLESAQGALKQSDKQVASLQKENASLAKLKDDNAALKKELSAASKAAKDAPKLEAANASLKTELAALNQEISTLQAQNKNLLKMSKAGDSNETTALKRELEESNRKLAQQAAMASRMDSLSEQLKDAQSTIAALRKDNQKMEKLLTDPSATVGTPTSPATPDAAMQRQLEAARKEAEAARKAADAATTQSARARMELDAALASAVGERKTLQEQNQALKAQLDAAMSASGKSNPRDAAKIKELEDEKDKLEKDLKTATKELNSRQARRDAEKVEKLADELANLKARLEVLDAKKVPYTRAELALFKQPEHAPTAPAETARPATQTLPDSARPLIAEAQRDFSSGRFADAERKYKQVLDQNDSHVYTLANLAAAQIEQNDYRGAEKNLEKALAIDGEDGFTLAQMGYLKMRQKKLEDAVTYLGRAAQADPKDAVVQNYLGVVLSEQGQRGAAEAALRKAVQLSPGYADAHNNLAVIYATQKPPLVELARWHYQKARAAGHPANADLEKILGGN